MKILYAEADYSKSEEITKDMLLKAGLGLLFLIVLVLGTISFLIHSNRIDRLEEDRNGGKLILDNP